MPTDDGIGGEIPQTCRAVQTIIQYRVAVGRNRKGNDCKVVRWARKGDLTGGGVPLFDGAIRRGGKDCVCRCPSDVPYFVALGCVEFNVLEGNRSNRAGSRDAYVLCKRGR